MPKKKKIKYTIPSHVRMEQWEIDKFCDNIDECDQIQMSFKTLTSMRGYLIRNHYNDKVKIDNRLGFHTVVFIWEDENG